ncbi:DUF2846 domain-containing protein [Comamonas sp. J-3]|uniref:DUF2846 domain-containing protein n=1 Tax=Comamonas trifloxystrobinivorans TaxID=3350256 RepID=UPI00372C0976
MSSKIILSLALASVLTGCASVNMASKAESAQAKAFNAPSKGKAAVYIYRNGAFDGSSKKDIFINGKCLGESVANVFFYTELEANKTHKIETESEFSPNGIDLPTQPDATYFVRQYIKMGAFVPGANLEIVSEAQGKADIAPLEMAQPGQCGG